MKRILQAGLGAATLLTGTALGAQALPLDRVPGAAPLVEQVAQGCGPGFFRGPRGFCRPMGYGPRPFYGPRPYARRFYGPRPYGYRW